MKKLKFIILFSFIFFSIFSFTSTTYANDEVEVSPKAPWTDSGEVEQPKKEEHSIFTKILLWPVNRVLDIIDILRFDLGVGPAIGAVVRVTKYGQVGYRQTIPASLRIGTFGRRLPVQLEYSEEIGVGPLFKESPIRKTCIGEVGMGADVLVFGAYAGVCPEEIFDFAAGIFFFDPFDDDI